MDHAERLASFIRSHPEHKEREPVAPALDVIVVPVLGITFPVGGGADSRPPLDVFF